MATLPPLTSPVIRCGPLPPQRDDREEVTLDYSDFPDPARTHLTAAAGRLEALADPAASTPPLKTQTRPTLPTEPADHLCRLQGRTARAEQRAGEAG
jgi:hypothetical protein